MSIKDVLERMSSLVMVEAEKLELFKCYSTKSMMKRPAEFPVEVKTSK